MIGSLPDLPRFFAIERHALDPGKCTYHLWSQAHRFALHLLFVHHEAFTWSHDSHPQEVHDLPLWVSGSVNHLRFDLRLRRLTASLNLQQLHFTQLLILS